MKLLAGALALAAVVFAFLYAGELRSNRLLAAKEMQLEAKLSDRSTKEADAHKIACSEKAAAVFKSLGYSDSDNGNSAQLPSYTNHYNAKLKRCLMLVELDNVTNGDKTQMFFDADERTPFGDYFWIPSKTKKYWEQPPIQCHMTPPVQEDSYCRSTDEWDHYVQTLMS